ncbi:MAG: hypothetical protein RIB71_16295 [Imperialibacter sp.]|uniref:hypothetical protein n=1 Tax=Imperialibacter sp. TaxID=2038411 RepID=UPI0032EE8194
MKQLVSILFIISLVLQSEAQLINDSEPSRFGLIMGGGVLSTNLYNPTFYYSLCFEGCQADEQDPITRPTFNAGVTYRVNSRNQFALKTGYSEYGFHENGTSWPGRTYKLDRIWKFWGLEAEHIWTFASAGPVDLFIGNGLRLEMPLNGRNEWEERVIKAFGTSYSGRLGTEIHLGPTLSLVANGIFKTSVFKYNKIDPVLDNNDYRPYGYGVEAGLKVKI